MHSAILASAVIFSLSVGLAPPRPAEPTRPGPTSGNPQETCTLAWIPIHGPIGATIGEPRFVTARDFDLALDEAERLRCRHVILDIDSPGGRTKTMEAMIRRIMEAQDRGVTVIALVRDAGSAAAFVTMACRRILVLPDARIGAAVSTVRGQSVKRHLDDDPELAAKYLSFTDALGRGAAEQAGHSGAIIDAMSRSECELWHAPGLGFSARRHHESARCLDGPTTVLTLSAMDVLTCGIGLQVGFDAPHDRFAHEIRDALDLPPGRRFDLDAKMLETPRRLARVVQRLEKIRTELPETYEEFEKSRTRWAEPYERWQRSHAELDRIMSEP